MYLTLGVFGYEEPVLPDKFNIKTLKVFLGALKKNECIKKECGRMRALENKEGSTGSSTQTIQHMAPKPTAGLCPRPGIKPTI